MKSSGDFRSVEAAYLSPHSARSGGSRGSFEILQGSEENGLRLRLLQRFLAILLCYKSSVIFTGNLPNEFLLERSNHHFILYLR